MDFSGVKTKHIDIAEQDTDKFSIFDMEKLKTISVQTDFLSDLQPHSEVTSVPHLISQMHDGGHCPWQCIQLCQGFKLYGLQR